MKGRRCGCHQLPASISTELLRLLKNQKYHLVGQHSAVKRCRWFYESLVHNRPCYKQKFYGIKSHQCVQMTPTVLYCNMRCRFCWRIQSGDLKLRWDETGLDEWDDPEKIVEGCIKAQLDILSGYKANPKADRKKYREALTPKHAAISLTGEPTLYPRLGELIASFHKRGFTTFLVSNGTLPETLTQLGTEPTQLYISLCAYDKKTFAKTCRPQMPKAWERLNETLSLLPSFKCPTVIRLTLVRHLNLIHPEQYARLIEKARPTYVEPKAYMHVGFSRLRLNFENMPSHREIKDFATKLAKEMEYKILDEAPESRVILLSRLEKPIKLS
ncbi:MAG: 4-demethylwyosine synthase TYW1 [Candidatus Bathyarchaeia archaeon]